MMKPETPKVGWETTSSSGSISKSIEKQKRTKKYSPLKANDSYKTSLLIEMFQQSQSNEPIKWKFLLVCPVACVIALVFTGVFLYFPDNIYISVLHFFIFNFVGTAVQVCWYSTFYEKPIQENSTLRSLRTLLLFPIIYSIFNTPVLHIAFLEPEVIGLSPWVATGAAFVVAGACIIALFAASYIFDVPASSKTTKLKNDWKRCIMLVGYNLSFLFIMMVYLLAFKSMTYELQIILAYLYPFLDWGFHFFQNKISSKVNNGLVVGGVFMLQMLSTSFFFLFMLSSASSSLGSVFLVIFRSLAHFMEYIRATDYYYIQFSRMPSSLHNQESNLREIYHFTRKVNFYITMVVEFICIIIFYPMTSMLHITDGTPIPTEQFFFVGIYGICLVVTAVLIWFGFKKIEASHKFHDKAIRALAMYAQNNWLSILYSVEFCTDMIYVGLKLSPK